MNQQMIGKSWLEWENDLPNDSDSAEEEFREYRQTVKKETPQLTVDHDIKSEVSKRTKLTYLIGEPWSLVGQK